MPTYLIWAFCGYNLYTMYYFSEKSCPRLSNPSNAVVSPKTGQFEDEVTYTCVTGYECPGCTMTRTCGSNAQWGGSVPNCQSMYMYTNGAFFFLNVLLSILKALFDIVGNRKCALIMP